MLGGGDPRREPDRGGARSTRATRGAPGDAAMAMAVAAAAWRLGNPPSARAPGRGRAETVAQQPGRDAGRDARGEAAHSRAPGAAAQDHGGDRQAEGRAHHPRDEGGRGEAPGHGPGDPAEGVPEATVES